MQEPAGLVAVDGVIDGEGAAARAVSFVLHRARLRLRLVLGVVRQCIPVLIGYLVIPPGSDAAAEQRQSLTAAGCEHVVEDQFDAETGAPPDPGRLLARVIPGDIIVVARLDCLGRSLPEMVPWLQQLAASGAGLRSLAEALDILAPWQVADAIASKDEGSGQEASVRRRGAGGRPPKLSPEVQAYINESVLSGHYTAAAMAKKHRVSPATISRLLAARRAGGVEPSAGVAIGQGDLERAGRILGVLPLSSLDERLAIVGMSGSGKTYAAKGLTERAMAGGGRVCVVDPLGVWWGLGKAADGAEPPFPVTVFGGSHADVPLGPGMGSALGQLIGTQPMACVVDVSDFGSAADRRGFMTAFIGALYAANTEPLHLVLDEADLWAPQRTQPDGRELLGRIEEVVRRGRVRGFVPWLITQRPAVLHKDVLSQADVLVSMRLTASQDRVAVGRWIEGQADRAEGRRILGALPQLRQGEGWIWAPGAGVLARVTFPRILTLDSSQTPRRTQLQGALRPLASVDPSAIGRALARLRLAADPEDSGGSGKG